MRRELRCGRWMLIGVWACVMLVLPAAAGARTHTLHLDARNSRFSDTGVALAAGQKAIITATGNGTCQAGSHYYACPGGPNGSGIECANVGAGFGPGPAGPNVPIGVVAGRVGSGTPFVIGSRGTATGPGEVFIIYNDCIPPKGYADNAGSFQVKITPAHEYSLSGVLTAPCDGDGCKPVPMRDVTVIATDGGRTEAGLSDAEGRYKITELAPSDYTVTPSLAPGGTSTPPSKRVHLNQDVAGVDFSLCTVPPVEGSACGPTFDYAMPERFSKTGDPVDVDASVFNPSHFDVVLTVKKGQCDPTAKYDWTRDGGPLPTTPGVGACQFDVQFPKVGVYNVTVEQSGGATPGITSTATKKVDVKDLVIATVGDSLASGEGARPYSSVSCDRSKSAYGVQAAKKIETVDKRSSVTLVTLACTGAVTEDPFHLTKNPSVTSASKTGTQLPALNGYLAGRRIDALLISVGINDVGFSDILKDCISWESCWSHKITDPLQNDRKVSLSDYVSTHVRALKEDYARLNTQIRTSFPRPPKHIYLVGYPSPVFARTGAYCETIIGTKLLGITQANRQDEVAGVQTDFLNRVERRQQDAAREFGWDYVQQPASFISHGLCAADPWFVTVVVCV